MLSRVAHSLYWMSRYIERAENFARLLDVNLQLLLDFQGFTDTTIKEHWGSILLSSGDEELFAKHYETPDSRNVTEFFAFDLRNPNSIRSSVNAARENARMIRDQISAEMWETINELYLYLNAHNSNEIWASGGAGEFFNSVKRSAHLFQGLTASTYSRNEGWEFIEFGKYIERADKTTRILDVKYHILRHKDADPTEENQRVRRRRCRRHRPVAGSPPLRQRPRSLPSFLRERNPPVESGRVPHFFRFLSAFPPLLRRPNRQISPPHPGR